MKLAESSSTLIATLPSPETTESNRYAARSSGPEPRPALGQTFLACHKLSYHAVALAPPRETEQEGRRQHSFVTEIDQITAVGRERLVDLLRGRANNDLANAVPLNQRQAGGRGLAKSDDSQQER